MKFYPPWYEDGQWSGGELVRRWVGQWRKENYTHFIHKWLIRENPKQLPCSYYYFEDIIEINFTFQHHQHDQFLVLFESIEHLNMMPMNICSVWYATFRWPNCRTFNFLLRHDANILKGKNSQLLFVFITFHIHSNFDYIENEIWLSIWFNDK